MPASTRKREAGIVSTRDACDECAYSLSVLAESRENKYFIARYVLYATDNHFHYEYELRKESGELSSPEEDDEPTLP